MLHRKEVQIWETAYLRNCGTEISIRKKNVPKKSKAVKDLLKLMGRNRDRLNDAMTEEQRETLEKHDDCINEMHCIMEQEIFAYAFRLGGQLMLAGLIDSGSEA